jgi:putative SOS response-associated peptidase YedK
MCGRFTLKTPVTDWLANLFPNWYETEGAAQIQNLSVSLASPRFNIAPSQQILILHSGRSGEYCLEPVRWGLLPTWADSFSVGYNMINARSESLSDKPSFRPSLLNKRCIVLADGYFEWKKVTDKVKVPYWIHRPNQSIFAMAGLWAENHKIRTTPDSVTPIRSATVITTEANADTVRVHDRMPAILSARESIHAWLDSHCNDKEHTEFLLRQLRPCEPGTLGLRHVSTVVNNPKNEGASLILDVDGLDCGAGSI